MFLQRSVINFTFWLQVSKQFICKLKFTCTVILYASCVYIIAVYNTTSL